MTQQEQVEFVCQILADTKTDIVNQIDNGKIPENWDGHELRKYIHEYIAATYDSVGYLKNKRKREYKNTIIINNLY